jgi:type I restriction enzyme S subunit
MSKVLLGEVSHERKETCKGSKEGYPIVGLEHLIPEEITLTTWDEGAENTFTKMFRKGDVLFGRRRAYLKKAAVAPFDGICSGDITVIEADPDKILPELLPFIIQNDDLFDFAVGKSAGSLSPRVKWEHLKNYELELPDMDKQKELAELLWAIDDTKKSYQKLIAATDELVKSQFMEQFGYPKGNPKGIPIMRIGEFGTVKGGKRLPKGESYADHITAHPYVRVIDMINHSVNIPELVYLTPSTHEKIARYTISSKDVYISIAGTIGQVGAIPDSIDGANLTENAAKIVLNKEAPVDRDYLIWYLSLPAGAEQIEEKTMRTTQPKLALYRIEEIEVLVPKIDEQRRFAEFVRQSDKSQFIEMFGYKNDDMKTIDDVANICRGASPRPIAKYVTDDENGINWIKIGDVAEEDIYITHTAEKITEDGAKKSRAVEPGDFILSNSMSFGRPYIVGIQGCVHDGWLIISDYQDYLDPLFFYYELRSDLVQRQFDGSANGSCVKNLNSDLVKKVKIHIPSMDKQKEFIEFAEQSDKSKLLLQNKYEKINQDRRLLTCLMKTTQLSR